MFDDPVQRAIAAKRNVKESDLENNQEARLRLLWQEKIVGGKKVQLLFQLTNETIVSHLKLAETELHNIAVAAARERDPQDRLFIIRARIRQLNKKLNAKRWA